MNSALVQANWLIGKQIVQAEQGGESRAAYNRRLLKTLSSTLQQEYGNGFSVGSLQYMRAFFLGYPHLLKVPHALDRESGRQLNSAKQHALRVNSLETIETSWSPGHLHPSLSWTHYRASLKVDRQEARDFYEIEAVRNGWSARQLERQINSLLFFRLLKSRDKEGLLVLANAGQQIVDPVDAIKDPYVLEFLDLPEYHRLYVIIDLKVEKLTHADLGQMQLYVHYYDREVAAPDDNPTLSLILCTDKNDAMVRYVLDEKNRQIFASNYQFHLPSEEELRKELRREIQSLGEPKPERSLRRKA